MNLGRLTFASAGVLALVVAFSAGAVYAQTGQISGTVTDSLSNETIPGVNVVIAGTQRGVATDANGNFTIADLEPGTYDLLASAIGYDRKTETGIEVRANETTTVNFELVLAEYELEELVAIGYGVQRQEAVTGAVSSVTSEDFVAASARDAAAMIRGQVAGLSISEPSGDPRAGSEISLRGTTTLMASRNPLVLIDGVPGNLNTVAPDDIESINVLKDGSAAAIYGSRGSNGVILITTREHRGDQPATIRYDGYVDGQTIARRPNFLTAGDYRQLINEGFGFEDFGFETDWQDQVLRNPVSHRHNLRFTGGDRTTNYTASINYRNDQGIFLRTDNEEVTGRVNVGHSMFDGQLEADLNLISRLGNSWNAFNGGMWRQALIRNPTDRIRNDNGTWQEREGYFYDNPLGLVNEADGRDESRELRLNGTLAWSPLDNLRLELMGASNNFASQSGYAETFQHVSTVNSGLRGYASRGAYSSSDQLLELTGTYDESIGDHQFTVLGGYSFQEVTQEGFNMSNYSFPTDLFGHNNMGIGDALTEGEANMGSWKNQRRLIGFFSRVNYEWNNRYMLMGSVRYEGDSRFGADHKWGLFPGISAGWRISEEPFMAGIDQIGDLRLRAGFGITGMAPSNPYQSLTSFSYGGSFLVNGRWVQGIQPTRNPNPDLRWERKDEYNIGLDFALLDYRLSGSVDVYQRDTRDMLWNFSVPVPPYLFSNIMANVGQMRNQGLEVSLNYNVVDNDGLQWSSGVNYSTNSNRLVSLSDELYEMQNDYFYAGYTGEPIQMPTHRVEIGDQIGNFYGFESVGIDEDGQWIVLDVDGYEISIADVNENDRRYLGNGIPNHHLAWNNSFEFGNFDANITMRGAFGHQILNFQRMFYENPTILQYNMLESAFDPVYGERLLNYDLAYTSHYIEDGDYWKLDNLTVGYTFGAAALEAVSNVRVYAAGRNLVTITGYQGMDPEVSTSGLAPGNDPRDTYPTTRTFTLGVSVTL